MPLAAIGHEGALTRTEGVTRYTSDGDLTPARTVRAAVTAALAKVAAVPGMEAVVSPYARAGTSQVSRDGTIAFAAVTWDTPPAPT